MQRFKARLKNSDSALAQRLFKALKALRRIEIPVIPILHSTLYVLHKLIINTVSRLAHILYFAPLFKSQLQNRPKHLSLYSGIPMLLGPLQFNLGDHCRVSGQTTISGRVSATITPTLTVGNNVDISWQNEIFVGDKIIIGNNVRCAVKVRLVGYPGHPIDPERRAQGLPDDDDQIGSIILEDDVWLAAGVTVMGGVTIGKGTIVATGSVVTKSLPAGVLAAGIPAQVVKQLDIKPPAEHNTTEDHHG